MREDTDCIVTQLNLVSEFSFYNKQHFTVTSKDKLSKSLGAVAGWYATLPISSCKCVVGWAPHEGAAQMPTHDFEWWFFSPLLVFFQQPLIWAGHKIVLVCQCWSLHILKWLKTGRWIVLEDLRFQMQNKSAMHKTPSNFPFEMCSHTLVVIVISTHICKRAHRLMHFFSLLGWFFLFLPWNSIKF